MKTTKMNRPKHQSSFVLIAAIAMAAVAFPAHAWRAAGGGGRGAAVGPNGAAAWNHNTAVATGPRGNTAAWNRGGSYYRPPARVYGGGGYYNNGYSGGQVAGAAVAGMAVGAMAGAAAASHSQPQQSTTVVVQQQAPVYDSQMPVGTQVTVLPGNCGSATVQGVEYYQCGPNWFKPYFGNSSVYYRVVDAPY